VKNFGLTILKAYPQVDLDCLIDEFENFLVSSQIGDTYSADSFGDDRFVICFRIVGDEERHLAHVEKFITKLPEEWNPMIQRLQ